jgi:hypothetical protein
MQELMRDDNALGEPLHAALPCSGAQIVWAARMELPERRANQYVLGPAEPRQA